MIKFFFDKKEIILTEVIFLIISELAFSFIIFIWFFLYKIGIIKKASPLFAIIISLIQNIIIIITLFKNNKISKDNIIRYFYILIIIKILPLLTFYPNLLNIRLVDIFITIYLYLIYIIIIISIIEIFNIKINLKKIIENDFFGNTYEKQHTTRIYDMTYNEIISKLF
jgi:hypothetical protein